MDAPSDSPVYEGSAQISDDEVPGLLYTYETDGIISFDPGMEHYYKTKGKLLITELLEITPILVFLISHYQYQ